MSFFVASFYTCQVLSNPRICRSFVAYFHITQWIVLAKLFQILGPIFVPRILPLLRLTFYRQNYNFDMLAMIWHETVCWFLKIYQDLKRFAAQKQRIVFVLTFRCAEQFFIANKQKQSKTGKNPEINRHRLSFDGINQENINLSDIY